MVAAVIISKIWSQSKPIHLRQNMGVHRMLLLNTSPEHVHIFQKYCNWRLEIGDRKLPSSVPNIH
jgi:hypothetical protein